MDINTYISEFKSDTIVNELNIRDKALALPALKAKWVSRIINHKNILNNLEKKKKQIINDIIPVVKENIPVKLSDNVIKSKAENTHEVHTINIEIDKEKEIIEFLERVEKVMSSFTYDLGNMVKVMQLETL